MLKSANLYGLVSGTGQSAIVALDKLGQEIVSPSSTSERQQALLSAFRNVQEFAEVEKFYGGKKIPEDVTNYFTSFYFYTPNCCR